MYDTSIEVIINKKDKEKFRNLSYKNSKTMSEYTRELIKIVILFDEMNKTGHKNKESKSEIASILNGLGIKND